MLNQGNISTAACVNLPPPEDARCQDPAFALFNPALCSPQPQLLIKPGYALACSLGSRQFKAFLVSNGKEQDVTAQTVFSTSDPTIAVIGATSGNATGLGAGIAFVQAAYQGMNATAELQVMAAESNCCESVSVAFKLMIDVTASMKQAFGGAYATRLDYAKFAALSFAGKVNTNKDKIGAISFSDSGATTVAAVTTDKAAVVAALSGIAQGGKTTGFYDALSAAFSDLAAVAADQKVLVIISDGEDNDPLEKTAAKDPFLLAEDFKAGGGIIFCLGVRASTRQSGFNFLSALATGGFFVNAIPGSQDETLDYLAGLMGSLCGGDCTPEGDVVLGQGHLDFSAFQRWNVTGGNVDLLGNGFFDLLPGNGLYVNLAGASAPHDGVLRTKTAIPLIAGHVYRLTARVAGNQIEPVGGASVKVSVVDSGGSDLLAHIVLSDYTTEFGDYSYSFTADASGDSYIEIQEDDSATPADPRWGCLIKKITLEDTTSASTLFNDAFDTDNLVYVPPRCGQGTTYFPSYGYYTGEDCAYLNTCLSEPPTVQRADPFPLPDIEAGTSGPPRNFTSTKQACQACKDVFGEGFVNVSAVPLAPVVTDSGAQNIQSALSGLTWQMHIGDPTATLNPASVAHDPPDQTAQITGITGDLFTVGLRIRGVVECKIYPYMPPGAAGIIVPGTGNRCVKWQGVVDGAGVASLSMKDNEYSLTVSDPPTIYLLNNWDTATDGLVPSGVYAVDYQFPVQIKAGATVTLRARSLDGYAWPNKLLLTVPEPPPINVSQPFAGQFLQMDVISITGGSTLPVLPYTREFTFSAAATVDNYQLAIPSGAANYPTEWTLEGSNDGSTWNILDARSGDAFVPHPGQTVRYPVEVPAAFLYYRLVFTSTSNGLPPSLSAASLYAAANQTECQGGTGEGSSQAAADDAAMADGLAKAQGALHCTALYESAVAHYDATCVSSGATVTRAAQAKSYNSQAEADASALAQAKALAEADAAGC